jgi:hypothetical protein
MNEKHRLLPYQDPDEARDLPPKYPHHSSKSPKSSPKEPSSPTAFRTTFACLSMHMRDRIRLLRLPPQDVAQILEIIRQAWPRGIQATRVYDEADEVKLHGAPWRTGNFGDDKVNARRLVCALLRGLFDMGWMLKAAVGISKKEFDKGMLIYTSPFLVPYLNSPYHMAVEEPFHD